RPRSSAAPERASTSTPRTSTASDTTARRAPRRSTSTPRRSGAWATTTRIRPGSCAARRSATRRNSSRRRARRPGVDQTRGHRRRGERHRVDGRVLDRAAPASFTMRRVRITAKEDYALRAALELALAGGGPLKREQIAEAQAIPNAFLQNILIELRHAE